MYICVWCYLALAVSVCLSLSPWCIWVTMYKHEWCMYMYNMCIYIYIYKVTFVTGPMSMTWANPCSMGTVGQLPGWALDHDLGLGPVYTYHLEADSWSELVHLSHTFFCHLLWCDAPLASDISPQEGTTDIQNMHNILTNIVSSWPKTDLFDKRRALFFN